MRSCSTDVSAIVIVENGASGLRRKIRATSASGGVALRPDLVERDEQVGVRAIGARAEEVLELGALARDVVDHQVEQHVVIVRHALDVGPCRRTADRSRA